jgi:large subunit ribosomal protein L9
MAARLASLEVVIPRKVGETEVLYGWVVTADIADALGAKGFEIDRRRLQLAEPIKKVSEADVPVKLHREVTATVKVRVVPKGNEASGESVDHQNLDRRKLAGEKFSPAVLTYVLLGYPDRGLALS